MQGQREHVIHIVEPEEAATNERPIGKVERATGFFSGQAQDLRIPVRLNRCAQVFDIQSEDKLGHDDV